MSVRVSECLPLSSFHTLSHTLPLPPSASLPSLALPLAGSYAKGNKEFFLKMMKQRQQSDDSGDKQSDSDSSAAQVCSPLPSPVPLIFFLLSSLTPHLLLTPSPNSGNVCVCFVHSARDPPKAGDKKVPPPVAAKPGASQKTKVSLFLALAL